MGQKQYTFKRHINDKIEEVYTCSVCGDEQVPGVHKDCIQIRLELLQHALNCAGIAIMIDLTVSGTLQS